jgi:hypothetical protein
MMIFFGQSKEIEQDLVIAFNLRKLILTDIFPYTVGILKSFFKPYFNLL